MGIFLNSKTPYTDYSGIVSDVYFIDKSELIAELIPALGKKDRYFCITRPRRFGKSVMACMVGAFFGKTVDARGLFERLKIAENKNYTAHLNRHNVIYIDFSRMSESCDSYLAYISRILSGLKEELIQEYADIDLDAGKAVWDIL